MLVLKNALREADDGIAWVRSIFVPDRQVARVLIEDSVEGPLKRLDEFGVPLQRKSVDQL
jgi:hypothetical protein